MLLYLVDHAIGGPPPRLSSHGRTRPQHHPNTPHSSTAGHRHLRGQRKETGIIITLPLRAVSSAPEVPVPCDITPLQVIIIRNIPMTIRTGRNTTLRTRTVVDEGGP